MENSKEMDAFTNICFPPIIYHIKFEENQTPMFPSFSCFLLLGCWRFPLRKRLLNNALFIWFYILRNVHHVLLYVDFMWTPWNISYFSCCWFELALRGRATMWWASCNVLQNLVLEKLMPMSRQSCFLKCLYYESCSSTDAKIYNKGRCWGGCRRRWCMHNFIWCQQNKTHFKRIFLIFIEHCLFQLLLSYDWRDSWTKDKLSEAIAYTYKNLVFYATVDIFQPVVIPWKKDSEVLRKLLKGEVACSLLEDEDSGELEMEEGDASLTPRIG